MIRTVKTETVTERQEISIRVSDVLKVLLNEALNDGDGLIDVNAENTRVRLHYGETSMMFRVRPHRDRPVDPHLRHAPELVIDEQGVGVWMSDVANEKVAFVTIENNTRSTGGKGKA